MMTRQNLLGVLALVALSVATSVTTRVGWARYGPAPQQKGQKRGASGGGQVIAAATSPSAGLVRARATARVESKHDYNMFWAVQVYPLNARGEPALGKVIDERFDAPGRRIVGKGGEFKIAQFEKEYRLQPGRYWVQFCLMDPHLGKPEKEDGSHMIAAKDTTILDVK